MVGSSLGMVLKVLNPRALSLGKSLTKAASPSDWETTSFFLVLGEIADGLLKFQSPVSERFHCSSPADLRCLGGTY